MTVYNPVRITAHETGHALGLDDTYDGPCTQLMSGGGQPPSCTNPQPDATERQLVEQMWANGFAVNAPKTANRAPVLAH